MKIFDLQEIKKRIDLEKITSMQEEGFIAYSAGEVDVPPVGYLKQAKPDGSYHLKYGLIKNDSVWILKVAGGPDHLPLNGLIMVFSTQTGEPEYLLKDSGYLTQLRTAVAGLIVAKHLSPKNVSAIGVIGTGEQARLQVSILKAIIHCRNVYVWGRGQKKAHQYKLDMEKEGFVVQVADSPSDVSRNCNLILTTTSSRAPILKAEDIQPGTHITAMGADAPGKMELDPAIFSKTDIAVVDSKSQCIDHGEICQAYKSGLIPDDKLIELGTLLKKPSLGRKNDQQVTIADLTGVAVQDIQIAKAIIS